MRLSPRLCVLPLAVCVVVSIQSRVYGQELSFESVTVVAVAPSAAEMTTAIDIGRRVTARLRESKVEVSGDLVPLQMDRLSAARKLSTIAAERKADHVTVVSYRRTGEAANEGLASVTVASALDLAKGIGDVVVVAMERLSEGAKAGLDWVAQQASDGVSAVVSRGQLVAIRLYVYTAPGAVTFAVGASSPGVTDSDGLAIWSVTQRPGTVGVEFKKPGYQDLQKPLIVPKASVPVTRTISANLVPLTH